MIKSLENMDKPALYYLVLRGLIDGRGSAAIGGAPLYLTANYDDAVARINHLAEMENKALRLAAKHATAERGEIVPASVLHYRRTAELPDTWTPDGTWVSGNWFYAIVRFENGEVVAPSLPTENNRQN